MVKELLRRDHLIITDQDEQQNTALHVAALEGHQLVVEVLIDAGAAVVARNVHLWTPLDCASAKGWKRTVEVRRRVLKRGLVVYCLLLGFTF